MFSTKPFFSFASLCFFGRLRKSTNNVSLNIIGALGYVSSIPFDLLFYHRGLQALVEVELKKTKFHPRDLGQMEFYLEALDRDVKRSNENPSIGIILCPEADRVVVEYAMSRSMSPTMIAEYKRILIPQERLQQQLDEFCNLFLTKK